ncbi:hypothetical protein QMK19_03150 [Streptomyces sp. H10-C2]|uniref:hypothetical protein n=1 Tax=unclassified Streptomyces TaxID=2593676 RepID=UPI0024BA85B9|nr:MULTISPECIES: hypothetical protein [unclassified Streptomyces]MDJ0342182.1 hypothetical protein [Streptomyces sp. PH10-H1]MDJ0368696.1 hypothetical protein [Streptomyces sp. H10-C2]
MNTIRIDVSESKGAFAASTHVYEDGHTIESIAWGTKCPGCDRVPAEGEQITRIFFTWWHAKCGAKYLRATGADEAWLALAQQLERAPSRFSNPETKAIVRNLLRIAGRFVDVKDPEAETVHGPRAGLRVLDGGGAR